MRTMEEVLARATGAPEREAFVDGFKQAWANGSLSHVRLDIARASADRTASYLGQMRVGGGGAKLEWQAGIAILTVDTMMTADTVEQIDAAFRTMWNDSLVLW